MEFEGEIKVDVRERQFHYSSPGGTREVITASHIYVTFDCLRNSREVNMNAVISFFRNGQLTGYLVRYRSEWIPGLYSHDDGDYLIAQHIEHPKKHMGLDHVHFLKSDIEEMCFLHDRSKESENFLRYKIKKTILGIYAVICKLSGSAAVEAAHKFLERNACKYILPEDLTENLFDENIDNVNRDYKKNIAQVALLKNGQKKIEGGRILQILAE